MIVKKIGKEFMIYNKLSALKYITESTFDLEKDNYIGVLLYRILKDIINDRDDNKLFDKEYLDNLIINLNKKGVVCLILLNGLIITDLIK